MEKVTLNGFTYEIELVNSDCFYGNKQVYHIKSDNDNYPKSRKDIEEIMNDGSWSKGLWITKNQQQPSMENAFHSYHEFSYNEELDVYVYTYVRPYDD